MPVRVTRVAPSLLSSEAIRYGTVTASPTFGAAVAPSANPENVAAGAPEIVAEVGCAAVMMQPDMTMLANDQSSPPSDSWSRTSKRLPWSASVVSLAATSPIALTVIENDSASGVYTTPMWVSSIEWSASALSVKFGAKASIGVRLTVLPSSSVYETASRVFQSGIPALLSELGGERHEQAVHRRAVGDRHEHVDPPVGARRRDLRVVGGVAGGLRDAEDVQHRDADLIGVDHGTAQQRSEDPVEARLQKRHACLRDARVADRSDQAGLQRELDRVDRPDLVDE